MADLGHLLRGSTLAAASSCAIVDRDACVDDESKNAKRISVLVAVGDLAFDVSFVPGGRQSDLFHPMGSAVVLFSGPALSPVTGNSPATVTVQP
jgi:hypothetical protein